MLNKKRKESKGIIPLRRGVIGSGATAPIVVGVVIVNVVDDKMMTMAMTTFFRQKFRCVFFFFFFFTGLRQSHTFFLCVFLLKILSRVISVPFLLQNALR